MGGKGGVVAAAVLSVQHQRQVQQLGFEGRVLAVVAQHVEEIFGGGEFRARGVNHQTAPAVIINVGVIAIDRQQRERGNQLQRLPQHIGDGDILGAIIEDIHGQNTLRHGVHHIATGQLEDGIVHEIIRQRPCRADTGDIIGQLIGGRQLPEKQQVADFLESVAAIRQETGDEVIHVQSAINQMSGAGVIPFGMGLHLADLRQAGQYALAVEIAQPALHVIFRI